MGSISMKKSGSKKINGVAARRKAGAELRQSEERYRSLVELSPDAISIHCEGKYVYINPAGASIFGASGPEDIIGKAVLDFVPPDYHEFVRGRMQQSYDRREPAPLRESKLVRLDGSCLDVEVVTAPIMYHEKPATQMILRDISARKRAEETRRRALEKAEEEKNKSDAIIAALSDGVSIQDRAFKVIYQNQLHRDLIGGDHVGEYCYKAYRKKDAVCEDCPLVLSFRDGKRHTEERTTTMGWGEVTVEIISSPLRDASGEIVAAVEVVRDITERRRVEKELRLFRTLIDQSNDFIFVADPETGRILDCNEIVSEKYGYTRREILAMKVIDFNVNIPDDRSWKQRVEDVIRRGALMVENVHQRKDGATFPVEVNIKPVVHEGRQYMLAVIRDISERRRMETERENLIKELWDLVATVSRSKQEWSDTFDNIQDPIYITDAAFNIVKANKAFSKFAGRTFPEILNRKCYDLLHGSCEPFENCPHQIMKESGMPVNVELVEPKNKRTLVVTHFPYRTPEGSSAGSINIVRDVTEEREKEMRFIMNERLASLGQMAASIAHEINNPLAAIMGCAEGMLNHIKQGSLDPVLFRKYLEIIAEEIARCQTMPPGEENDRCSRDARPGTGGDWFSRQIAGS